jgi:hypothetical protein
LSSSELLDSCSFGIFQEDSPRKRDGGSVGGVLLESTRAIDDGVGASIRTVREIPNGTSISSGQPEEVMMLLDVTLLMLFCSLLKINGEAFRVAWLDVDRRSTVDSGKLSQ